MIFKRKPKPPPVRLAEHTTLRLGGPAEHFDEIDDVEKLCDYVCQADDAGLEVLILGGGSNVVIADEGFAGVVIKVATRGIAVADASACGGATVRVAAGENWDDFVQYAIGQGWTGVEALSGIPGLVGAAPIQNIGAYGQEVADTIAQVRVWDREEWEVVTLAAADCGFGYRTSRFKRSPERYVVLEVVFQFKPGELSGPVKYAELARTLGVELGERAPMPAVREAVLGLRRGKGMVLDPGDHDTWSAGSFFTNPVLTAEQADALPIEAPRWPQPDGTVKTSAAWLIEHSGFTKGYGSGPAQLSGKHTLALTNRGQATTADLLALARQVRDGVHAKYGLELAPEPVLIGCTL
ncbi:UDP-N-acetylmuramate dehydrogenase [Flindersiella endophytica]